MPVVAGDVDVHLIVVARLYLPARVLDVLVIDKTPELRRSSAIITAVAAPPMTGGAQPDNSVTAVTAATLTSIRVRVVTGNSHADSSQASKQDSINDITQRMNADAVQFLYAHYAGSGYVDEMVVRAQMFPQPAAVFAGECNHQHLAFM